MLFTALIVSLGFLWFHLHVPRSLYQSQVHGKKICHGQLTNQNGFPRCINALFVFFASLQWRHLVPRLPYTLPLICMSLNKNSIYCVMLRSSKNADQREQWWYRVAGYSAVAPWKYCFLRPYISSKTAPITEVVGNYDTVLNHWTESSKSQASCSITWPPFHDHCFQEIPL